MDKAMQCACVGGSVRRILPPYLLDRAQALRIEDFPLRASHLDRPVVHGERVQSALDGELCALTT